MEGGNVEEKQRTRKFRCIWNGRNVLVKADDEEKELEEEAPEEEERIYGKALMQTKEELGKGWGVLDQTVGSGFSLEFTFVLSN